LKQRLRGKREKGRYEGERTINKVVGDGAALLEYGFDANTHVGALHSDTTCQSCERIDQSERPSNNIYE
jgi:hypothetical protein